MDNKMVLGALFLDFSAASDVIDHNLILKKLTCYGFTSPAITSLESCLSNRTQGVIFNGSFSNIRYVQCGIPQGSFLGPLRFSIFRNDLPLVLQEAKMTMYADDCTLHLSTYIR
jgi:hypothetical protein